MAGYNYLLMAVRLLLDDGVDVRLGIAAGGPAQEHLRYDVCDLALGHVVTQAPAGSCAALSEADLFVLAAVRGDYSTHVSRAILAGLFVVASDRPDVAGLLSDATGTVVPARDSVALAVAIAQRAAR